MIYLTILTGIPAVVIGAWLLIETASRNRFWLALAIPVLVAWPIGSYAYSASFLGYATEDQLSGEFQLISSFADDESKAVFALVRIQGQAPRLYKVTASYEQNRKKFAEAQAQADKGVPMVGRRGVKSEGDFVFYRLPPQNLPSKD